MHRLDSSTYIRSDTPPSPEKVPPSLDDKITKASKRAISSLSAEQSPSYASKKPRTLFLDDDTLYIQKQRILSFEEKAKACTDFFTIPRISLADEVSSWSQRSHALINDPLEGEIISLDTSNKESAKGVSSTFFLVDTGLQKKHSVIKPAIGMIADLHRPLRLGIPYHEMVVREQVASVVATDLLSVGIDARLPKTTAVQILSDKFPTIANYDESVGPISLTCSMQEFVPNTGSVETLSSAEKEAIPPLEIRTLAILDILLNNTDRREANTLIGKDGHLIPIDHSLTLSKDLIDKPRFFWLTLSSAKTHFSPREKAAIARLDWNTMRSHLLEEIPGLDSKILEMANTTLEFLKIGAALDLTPFELGSFMLKSRFHNAEQSFLQVCHDKALTISSDFSTNIIATLHEYLEPCALALRNPEYSDLQELLPEQEGVKSYALQACANELTYHITTGAPFSAKSLSKRMDMTKERKESVFGGG